MSLYDALSDLELSVENYSLDKLQHPVPPSMLRTTTVIQLQGEGEIGLGEDVTYGATDQTAFQSAGPFLPLAGRHTLREFSERLDELPLWPVEPEDIGSRHYRRWAFESAALDLALRQAGRSLAEVLGIRPLRVRFVVSIHLSGPQHLDRVRSLLRDHPRARLKLDATSAWTEALVAELAETGAVDIIDLKGAYRGTPVDQEADPTLYRRVLKGFPEAWIEDPALAPEVLPVLRPHFERVTWDAPIHSVADIQAPKPLPLMVNFKPSRFGSLRTLFDAYDFCREQGIGMYGGGQFELGVGRGQIQYLASLFHPEAPNDVAPIEYNTSLSTTGLPDSPLSVAPAAVGFRWEA